MLRLILALGGVLAVFIIGGTLDLASPASRGCDCAGWREQGRPANADCSDLCRNDAFAQVREQSGWTEPPGDEAPVLYGVRVESHSALRDDATPGAFLYGGAWNDGKPCFSRETGKPSDCTPGKDTCPSAADIAREIAEQGDKLFSCVPTLQCPPAGPSLTQGKCRKCITKAGRWWCRGCALDFAE